MTGDPQHSEAREGYRRLNAPLTALIVCLVLLAVVCVAALDVRIAAILAVLLALVIFVRAFYRALK